MLISHTATPLASSVHNLVAMEVLPAPPGLCTGGVPEGPERDRLYDEFGPLVRRLIRQYGSEDAELRKDLEGEIYCRFCSLLEAYDAARGVPLRPYIVRQLSAAVYTFARRQWRAQRREVSLDHTIELGGNISSSEPGAMYAAVVGTAASRSAQVHAQTQASDPTRGWDDDMLRAQVLSSLAHLIGALPRRQRQVVLWRYYEQRSFEEIAVALDIKPATARSLLRHGLTSLRRSLEKGILR